MSSEKRITVPYTRELSKLTSSFSCGTSMEIDNFLKSSRALDRDFGATYVMLNKDKSQIVGFYCISTGQLDLRDGTAKYKESGSAHICYFALDVHFQGIKQDDTVHGTEVRLSDLLLADCFDRIREVRNEHIGFAFVTLGATQRGRSLYERNGFEYYEADMTTAKYSDDGDTLQMYYAFGWEEV